MMDPLSKANKTEIVVIDFESTGAVRGYPNEPWQIGMVVLKNGRIDIKQKFTSFLRVDDRPFNKNTPGMYHQFRKEISQASTLRDLWPKMKNWWLDRPLVAHNIGTEKKFIHHTAPIHHFGPWIDTLQLARVAYPHLKSHALEDLLLQFNLMNRVCKLCPGLLPHDALFDAVGCAALLEHLLQLEGWQNVTIHDLVNAKRKFIARKQ